MINIRVLGSAAGGGYPQWNCNCETCRGHRDGSIQSIARTQSSIAVSSDVMLMDSQIDHTTGLLSLREHSTKLPLYCTQMVYNDLTSGFPVIKMLEHYCGVDWHEISLAEQWFSVPPIENIEFRALVIDSKAPPYSPHRHDPHPGDNIAVIIRSKESGKTLFYSPGLGGLTESTREVMRNVDCLMVDGTTWTNEEMQQRGVGSKLASEMGHLQQSGSGGMLEELRDLDSRKILIHINNTNPILDPYSAQSKELTSAGVEVAHDGMHVIL